MTRCKTSIIPLSGYRLPLSGAHHRKYTRPASRRTPHYLERYDAHTLFYDCVYLDDEGGFLFTAPRFLNLWPLFRAGLRLHGQPVRKLNRRTWLRCEQVFVPGPKGALSLMIDGTFVNFTVRSSLGDEFDNLDCLVAVSKNNDISWICNWGKFHAAAQGTQGIVLFDNGSTDYALGDLADRLAAETGVQRIVIFSAPFPYGPADRSGRFDVSPRFFQSAMLNLARRDAFARAAGVLSVDIDELVTGPGAQTIYEKTRRNPLGMCTIRGSWVYADPQQTGSAGQEAHVYRASPERPCNFKWCMRPQGVMAQVFGWSVHKVGGALQHLFTHQRDHHMLHCRATSTSWKSDRTKMPANLVFSDDLQSLMARHFGDRSSDAP